MNPVSWAYSVASRWNPFASPSDLAQAAVATKAGPQDPKLAQTAAQHAPTFATSFGSALGAGLAETLGVLIVGAVVVVVLWNIIPIALGAGGRAFGKALS